MKYLLLSLVIAGASLIGVPCFADSGVGATITLTTTIVGGGSDGFDSGGSYSNSIPDWSSIFPSMNQPQSSASSYTAPQQTYIPIPEPARVVASTPSESVTPVITPIETTPEMDKAVWAGIAFWAIVIGLFVWLLSWLVDRRRAKKVQ